MNFLDRAFVLTDTENNPKHVAGLHILSLPEGKSMSYVDEIFQWCKSKNHAEFPFDSKITVVLGWPLRFDKVASLDMDYHVKLSEVDDVGHEEHLNDIVAQIHAVPMDRARPLWQFHFIKSKNGNQFALYMRVHHVYGDGLTLLRMNMQCFTDDPDQEWEPFWLLERKSRRKVEVPLWKFVLSTIWSLLVNSFDMIRMSIKVWGGILRIHRSFMPPPFSGKKTVLTGRVTQGRTIATLKLPMDSILNSSKRLRVSVNELMLTAIDIGVHQFLKDYDHSFSKPLIANMPISLRRPEDKGTGNKIAITLTELAYGSKDPYERLRQIVDSQNRLKRVVRHTRPTAFMHFSIIVQSLPWLVELMRLDDLIRPNGNIVISNMPGPKEARYMNGCKLEALFPISTLTPGGGVNITLISYDGEMNIGFVTSNRKIASIAPLAEYTQDAYELLIKSIDDHTTSTDELAEHPHSGIKSVFDDAALHNHHQMASQEQS